MFHLILSTKGVFQPSVCHRPKASNLSLPHFQTHGFSRQVSLIENSYNGADTFTSQIHKACHTTLLAIPEEGGITKKHDRQQPAICCFLGKASHAAMTTYPWKKNKYVQRFAHEQEKKIRSVLVISIKICLSVVTKFSTSENAILAFSFITRTQLSTISLCLLSCMEKNAAKKKKERKEKSRFGINAIYRRNCGQYRLSRLSSNEKATRFVMRLFNGTYQLSFPSKLQNRISNRTIEILRIH